MPASDCISALSLTDEAGVQTAARRTCLGCVGLPVALSLAALSLRCMPDELKDKVNGSVATADLPTEEVDAFMADVQRGVILCMIDSRISPRGIRVYWASEKMNSPVVNDDLASRAFLGERRKWMVGSGIDEDSSSPYRPRVDAFNVDTLILSWQDIGANPASCIGAVVAESDGHQFARLSALEDCSISIARDEIFYPSGPHSGRVSVTFSTVCPGLF